jgi:methylenetetrahydrofolate dehydrogenase (NADP+)/methenyltetrahydrofolate cyclohydrolase
VAARLSARVQALPRAPRLAIIRVGEDPRSAAYIRRKRAFGEKIGAEVALETLPESTTQVELEAAVIRAGGDPENDGVLLQLPAGSLDGYAAAALVPLEKDVDGLAPGSPFPSATAAAVVELLNFYCIGLAARRVAVVGQSRLVGVPFAEMARAAGAQVSVADIATADLRAVTADAEVVVAAVGKPGLISADIVAAGATVIDVGTTLGPDGKLLGDLDPAAVSKLAAYSPVPGGVGPVTVASLLSNLLDAAERRRAV